ncbi:Oidioi.mRNA.OKI2018_I69.PAR.g12156.t1.cds [Oikopleura dioica]|uniref:Oidioi.mRNA.OKI2018_I69.PAR.g12156.t1.cds n=1 Tax=Oikopleura dioica TaxID=34765 RepID=A0ABN7RYX5_OIKDI|nr:Oidioi.mRNA.OKI2018_I69.PAR.g12156.t1.cds [Oikopleura dioica]
MFEDIATFNILADLETIASLLSTDGSNCYYPDLTTAGHQLSNSMPTPNPSQSYYPPPVTPVPQVMVLLCSSPDISVSPSASIYSPDYICNSVTSSPASLSSPPQPMPSINAKPRKKRVKVQQVRNKKSKYCPCKDCITARFERKIRPRSSRHPCIVPDCKSSFARPCGLKTHLLLHEKGDPSQLQCFICASLAFSTRDTLIEHVLDHEAMSTGFVNPALPLPPVYDTFVDPSLPFDYSSYSYSM